MDDAGCFQDLAVEFDRSIAPDSLSETESADFAVDVTNVGQGSLVTARLLVLVPAAFEITNQPSATQGSCSVIGNLVDCLLGEIVEGAFVGAAFGITLPCFDSNTRFNFGASVVAADDLNSANNVDVLSIDVEGPCTRFEVKAFSSGPLLDDDPASEAFVNVVVTVSGNPESVAGVPVVMTGEYLEGPIFLGNTDPFGHFETKLPVLIPAGVVEATFDATGDGGTGTTTTELYAGNLILVCNTAPATMSEFLFLTVLHAGSWFATAKALVDVASTYFDLELVQESLAVEIWQYTGASGRGVYATRMLALQRGIVTEDVVFWNWQRNGDTARYVQKLHRLNPFACGSPA